jgi:hypothetical protein
MGQIINQGDAFIVRGNGRSTSMRPAAGSSTCLEVASAGRAAADRGGPPRTDPADEH